LTAHRETYHWKEDQFGIVGAFGYLFLTKSDVHFRQVLKENGYKTGLVLENGIGVELELKNNPSG